MFIKTLWNFLVMFLSCTFAFVTGWQIIYKMQQAAEKDHQNLSNDNR
jgi:preprotein translocase subunit YajC